MTETDARPPIDDPVTDPTAAQTEAPAAAGCTRREALRLTGLTLGGLAVSGSLAGLASATAQAAETCESCCPEDPNADQCDGDCDADCTTPSRCSWTSTAKATRYTYFDRLNQFAPFANTATTVQRLDPNALRITLMGTAVPPRNLAQRMVSVFVEVGWNDLTNLPMDQFVFDIGTGSSGSYNSMNVGYGRMNKVFLTHLHADHTGDLTHVYCFGPSGDRKSPLWVWGSGPSGVRNPNYVAGGTAPEYYDDGTAAFCSHLRDACRWHSESFSFQYTAYDGYPDTAPACDDPRNFGFATDPDDRTRVQPPAGPAGQYADDPNNDGYALMPVEIPFDWSADWSSASPEPIVVYENNAYDPQNPAIKTRITAYPVIHARKGAVSYKLEWTNPNGDTLSMIFTGDTKPERLTIAQAGNGGAGIDVLIHEMGVPPEVWAMKAGGFSDLDHTPPTAVCLAKKVQTSSHTPQGAFGYLLSQITPLPGLTVATHFPTADDTVQCAMNSLKAHLPRAYQGERPNPPRDAPRVTFAFDLMVITVAGDRRITEQRGVINPFGFQPTPQYVRSFSEQLTPKYHCTTATDGSGGDPLAQINSTTTIWPCNDDGDCNYRDDGY